MCSKSRFRDHKGYKEDQIPNFMPGSRCLIQCSSWEGMRPIWVDRDFPNSPELQCHTDVAPIPFLQESRFSSPGRCPRQKEAQQGLLVVLETCVHSPPISMESSVCSWFPVLHFAAAFLLWTLQGLNKQSRGGVATLGEGDDSIIMQSWHQGYVRDRKYSQECLMIFGDKVSRVDQRKGQLKEKFRINRKGGRLKKIPHGFSTVSNSKEYSLSWEPSSCYFLLSILLFKKRLPGTALRQKSLTRDDQG